MTRTPVKRETSRPPETGLDPSRHRDGTDPEHVTRTGLPPGISIDDAKDPGNAAANKKPVDNRS